MPRKHNAIVVEKGVAYVLLPHFRYTIVDTVDLDLVTQFRWRVDKPKQINHTYAVASISGLPGKHIYLHRVIMNPPDDLFVDHINGNGLDNRRENLRLATASQNMANSHKQVNNKSGFIGVRFHKHAKRWEAYAKYHDRQIHIGYFDTAEEAAEARMIKVKELFGEFARVA